MLGCVRSVVCHFTHVRFEMRTTRPHAHQALHPLHVTMNAVARKLQAQAQELEVEPELLAVLAQQDSRLLLLKPLELQARLTLLGSVLQLPTAQEVLELVAEHPLLLARCGVTAWRPRGVPAVHRHAWLVSMTGMASQTPPKLYQ